MRSPFHWLKPNNHTGNPRQVCDTRVFYNVGQATDSTAFLLVAMSRELQWIGKMDLK